jgi:TRAP-type C4-dicarboxylate transport system substrate-binding protein
MSDAVAYVDEGAAAQRAYYYLLSKKPVLSSDRTKTNPVTNKINIFGGCCRLAIAAKTATRRSVDAVVVRGQEPGKTGRRIAMFKPFMRSAVVALALLPVAAAAEPIKLKLAFFSSDRANVYLAAIKPFVDAVNAEAKGLIAIEVHFSGALGKAQAEQAQLVLDGKADIAFVTPGLTADRFPDNAVIELPGLYRDMREATLVYTRLTAADALRGYEDFFVIGAFASEPQSIHTRQRVTSLDDLKGMKIRANNPMQAATLAKLGMVPVIMPLNQVANAISAGTIDGAPMTQTILFEFGVSRVATFHFFLGVGGSPLAVLMNRKKFESMPARAQEVIRNYSGEWTAQRFIKNFDVVNLQMMEQLKSDPKRAVVFPSKSDMERAAAAFRAVTDEEMNRSPHSQELLRTAKSKIAGLRASE